MFMLTFNEVTRRFQMKFLKILLILLVPALGIVGCHKSDTKPSSCSSSSNKESEQKLTDNGQSAGRYGDMSEDDETGSDPIVGSGEDDRDGGDKKKKLR